MPETARAYRPGLPEGVAAVALAGIAWVLWPQTTATPPTALQCAHPDSDGEDLCFVQIPGGTFTMGVQAADPSAPAYDPDALPTEGPPHRVDVSPFWMTETEVLVGTYRACVQAGACSEDEVAATGGFSTYYPASERFDPMRDVMPVNSVSWKGAADACAFLGGRLPTEAEWEWAARGSEHRRWPWGSQPQCPLPPQDDAFFRVRDRFVDTCEQDGPVRGRALPNPSPFGLFGMAGNLWEWTADWYADDAYAQHARRDPTGPASGERRAQRGGGWTSTSPLEVRATVRGGLEPDAKLNDVGFRCAYGGAQ